MTRSRPRPWPRARPSRRQIVLVSSVALATCAATGIMVAAASDLVTTPRIGRTTPLQGEGAPPPAVVVPGPEPAPPSPPARPESPKVPAQKRYHAEPPRTASPRGSELPGLSHSGVGQPPRPRDRLTTTVGLDTGRSSTKPLKGSKNKAKGSRHVKPPKPVRHIGGTKHTKSANR